MAVKVVDPLEMVEVEDEEHAGPGDQRIVDRTNQLAPVGETGGRVGVGVAVGEPGRCVISVKRFLEILGAAPTEQDDGDVEEEGRAERAVRIADRNGAKRRGYDAASQRHEQQDRGRRCTSSDDVAARDANGLAAHLVSALSTH